MQHRTVLLAACALALLLALPLLAADQPEYEVGGPLAGVKLPLFPTQQGEEPGYPGSIPELAKDGKTSEDMGNVYTEWSGEGQPPQLLLYPGSIENYRAYMFKYMPIRSFFDQQSQQRNFVAPQIPGAQPGNVEEYAAPIFWVSRHAEPKPTGRFNKPVPVVRLKIKSPVLQLDLGELEEGLYVVRAIAAVAPADVRDFRKPLFVSLRVNDGLKGEESVYRMRIGYCEEFYSVAEIYFHAPAKRHYQAQFCVDEGSQVDLLVHNVSLDDALVGVQRQALKTRTTLHSADVEAKAALEARKAKGQAIAPPLSAEQRLARDAALWNAFPPDNAQGSDISQGFGGSAYGTIRGLTPGTPELSAQQIVEQFGTWQPLPANQRVELPAGLQPQDVFLYNKKLNLFYSHEDLRQHKPLPDPYPVKDDGAGVYFPDPADPAKGWAWSPIGHQVHDVRRGNGGAGAAVNRYRQTGDPDAARDAAILLVRWAYAFPTLDVSRYLSSTVHVRGPFGRDYATRRRETVAFFISHYANYVDSIMYDYDAIYDYLRRDNDLPASLARFVPWIKTNEDVIKLIDMYLVQTTAKRIMRYHYHTGPTEIANLASVVGDTGATGPWMQWLFARTFVYPLPAAGVQDTMISGTTREGTELVGSGFYAQDEGASRIAESLEQYIRAGGEARYDLSNPSRYPKPQAHLYWRLATVVAGGDFLRIGDVVGPDKAPGMTLVDLSYARLGWQWTKDPAFAYMIAHYLPTKDLSPAQLAEIEAAAAKYPRAPWLENRSRVMPMWAGVLETGTEHDDRRFRRAAYLRIGYGMGHQHDDGLDLQVVAHGLPMTIDAGQRGGYSNPGDRMTRVHNTVEVDGASYLNYSYATALSDQRGARYLAARLLPPQGVSHYSRAIALVDVDEGQGSAAITPEQALPRGAALPAGVVTANSYVFDVVRVAGGKQHTYCFHGPLQDEFTWNAGNLAAPAPGSAEAEYLAPFHLLPERNQAGDAPANFQATWRYRLDKAGIAHGAAGLLGASFDPQGPRHFTRLHLPGLEQARALRGDVVCHQWKYDFATAMIQRKDETGNLQSAFAAIIEPYAGAPFIASLERLSVANNQSDAQQAVAVLVKTVHGNSDLCFSDGYPQQQRTIEALKVKLSGEFALYSTDAKGLRLATITGGTMLDTPALRLLPAQAQRQGKVVQVDYASKTLWLDQAWPARKNQNTFQMGPENSEHQTSYTALAMAPKGERTQVTLEGGADYFRSSIEAFEKDGVVRCTLKPLNQYIPGNWKDWVASDESMKHFWRADYLDNCRFQLRGGPVDAAAFGEEKVLRLWEYGVGDTVRQATSAALRRNDQGVYELTSDVAITVALPASGLEISTDGKAWASAGNAKTANGWTEVSLPESEMVRFLRAVK